MDLLQALALLAAGMVAGAINVIVGSGTLVTFPTLLAFGYPSVLANVSNTIGLVPGSVAGAIAYRRELREQRERVLRLAGASTVGGITGALVLLKLPSSAFDAIVPVLILLGCALVVAQPSLSGWVARRRTRSGTVGGSHGGVLTFVLVFFTGVYGGYFGAAQGVLLMAIMGILINDDLQRLNGVKNVLAGLVNFVAAIVFILASHVAWDAAALIAVGSTLGGTLGGRYGRRLPPQALRGFIVVVGLVAAVRLLAT
jgi:uncharacterized membrane protein YfcA